MADLPEDEREVVHYLYADDEARARALAAGLEREGLGVRRFPPDDAIPQWSVHAFERTAVDLMSIADRRARLTAVAAEHGGEYDGWDAALEP